MEGGGRAGRGRERGKGGGSTLCGKVISSYIVHGIDTLYRMQI